MHRAIPTILATLALAWAPTAAALGPGKADGTLTVGRDRIELKTAYAVHYFNEEGLADSPELRILLADRKVDVEHLGGPRIDPIERSARKGQVRGILLRLDPAQLGKAPVRGTLLAPPQSPTDSLMHFTITGDAGGFEGLQVSKDRAQGKALFRSTGGDGAGIDYRVAFNAPLLADRPTARLIGARAQESPPAKAVLSFERALLDGDMATVSAHTTPDRFAGLDADFTRVGPVVFLEQVRAQLPDPAIRPGQIREVVLHGHRAWVVMLGDDGSRTIATLAHTDGNWKLD